MLAVLSILNQSGPLIGIVIAAMVVYLIYKKVIATSAKDDSKPWPLGVNASFLTTAEQSFFGVLTRYVEDKFVVCPKVNLNDVVYIKRGTDARLRQTIFNKISRKHLDFLLLDPKTLVPVFAVELDDSSHKSSTAQKRDAVKDRALKDAGLKLVRIPAKKTYTYNDLTDAFSINMPVYEENEQEAPAIIPAEAKQELNPIQPDLVEISQIQDTEEISEEAAIPACPKCQTKMVLRTASKGTKTGRSFWGCANYPHCRGTRPLTGDLEIFDEI